MSCADKALAVMECIAAGIISALIMAALGAIIKIPGILADIAEEIKKIEEREKRMSEYIKRKDAAELMKLIEARAAAVYAGGGRHRKEIQRAIRETAETFLQAIEDPEALPEIDAERRIYSYLKTEGDYRMIPCDDKMTCANCGFTRPMLRNERIFRCQNCGAYFTGAGI